MKQILNDPFKSNRFEMYLISNLSYQTTLVSTCLDYEKKPCSETIRNENNLAPPPPSTTPILVPVKNLASRAKSDL